jgi:DNA-directed RNA polymerase subunit RPC12/RpoP
MNYLNTQYPQETTRVCPECNNKILLVNRTVIIEEGQFNPVTTSYYECSNKECSDNFKKREETRKAQELARKEKRPKRF